MTRPASQVSSDVRRHNLALVLGYIVAEGPSARSDIAAGTGLTRGAVTALAGALTEAGILREGDGVSGGAKGRPRTLLGLAADAIALVAVQLDADRATAVAVDLSGKTLARFEQSHGRPMGRPDPVLDVLGSVLGQALEAVATLGRRVADLTVVVFAPVGGDPAVVLADTDLGWGRVDVLGGLRQRVSGLPAEIGMVSDSTVAALAEHRLLPGVSDLIYLKSNSGIGGAIISGGQLVQGANGIAGALGHVPIDHDGAPCSCGQRGCLVTVAGPDVVLERAGLGEQLRSEGLSSALAEFTNRVLAGDALAVDVWIEAARWVGRALQILTLSVDPDSIVLGGYWDRLSSQIEAAFRSNRPLMDGLDISGRPRVIPGRLGDEAAILGALWSARDRLFADPLHRAV